MMIPAENLYYVLCYAWERLDRLQAVPDNVRSSSFDLPQDLLARLLCDNFSQVGRIPDFPEQCVGKDGL